MMDPEAFKIYVDRLKDGAVEKISESVSADFLEQKDEDLSFTGEVKFDGEAYVVEKELLVHLNFEVDAIIPCAICNVPAKLPLKKKGLYIVEPLEKVKSGIYNFKEQLRTAIILEAPRFVKCGGKKCLREESFEKYLRSAESQFGEPPGTDFYKPFDNIDFLD